MTGVPLQYIVSHICLSAKICLFNPQLLARFIFIIVKYRVKRLGNKKEFLAHVWFPFLLNSQGR